MLFAMIQVLNFALLIGTIALMFVAYRHLEKQALSPKQFFIWCLVILFIPLIGSMMGLTYFDRPRATN